MCGSTLVNRLCMHSREEKSMTKVEKANVFRYLDDLRESGEINMFGAGSYVKAEFAISKYEARDLVKEWMQCFEKEK